MRKTAQEWANEYCLDLIESIDDTTKITKEQFDRLPIINIKYYSK